MDKRALAIVLALLVAVPAAVCMAQDESDAFDGTSEGNPVDLGALTLNVGETKKVDIRNNETAYADYESYTMAFAVKNNGNYTDIVTFTSTDGTSSAQTVGGVKVDVARQGAGNDGKFALNLTGATVAAAADVLIRCTVTVTENGNTLTDEIYYKVSVTVIGADGALTFTNNTITAISGENVSATVTASESTGINAESVYAYGLPAGLNVSVSSEDSGVSITVVGMTTEVSANQETGTPVYVVVRDDAGVEYGGTINVIVKEEASNEYTAEITDATPTGVVNSYYVLDGTETVTLKITGTEQAFAGEVFVLSYSGSSLSRTELNGSASGLVTTYTVPVQGLGTYVIEILNVDGTVEEIVLSVVPQSVGAGAGLIIVGS